MWVAIVMIVVSLVLAYAMQPKPPTPAPASLDDFDFPTAEEGRDIAVWFGDNWMEDPNVLWYGDLGTSPIKAKSK